METLKDILQEDWRISKTEEYFSSPDGMLDMRTKFSPKKETQINLPEYTQVFSDKFGFIPNLSILDLIFMEGTNTENYLNNLTL